MDHFKIQVLVCLNYSLKLQNLTDFVNEIKTTCSWSYEKIAKLLDERYIIDGDESESSPKFRKLYDRIKQLQSAEDGYEKILLMKILNDDGPQISRETFANFLGRLDPQMNYETIAETANRCILTDVRFDCLAAYAMELHIAQHLPEEIWSAKTKRHLYTEQFNDTILKYRLDPLLHINLGLSYGSLLIYWRKYLMRDEKDRILEDPRRMYMRFAMTIAPHDIVFAQKIFYSLCHKLFSPASTSLYFAGQNNIQQMNSCFIMDLQPTQKIKFIKTVIDNLSGGGGVGTNCSTLDNFDIISMFNIHIGILNEEIKQRPSGLVFYLEPWHYLIEEFLQFSTPRSDRFAKHLFFGLMLNDLFMIRLLENKMWSLFKPIYELHLKHGKDFISSYLDLEKKKLYTKQVSTQELFKEILNVMRQSGMPFLLFKDQINRCNMNPQRGIISTSNLCTEIMLPTSTETSTAVCTIASVTVSNLIRTDNDDDATAAVDEMIDWDKLHDTVRTLVRVMNIIIDTSIYVEKSFEHNHKRFRPIGIGVQGQADLFYRLGLSFEQDESVKLSALIFEHVYYAALKESCELAKQFGPFDGFERSLYATGTLHFDFFTDTETHLDFDSLRSDIKRYGLRNSNFTAVMPTSMSSLLFNNSESVDPYFSNFYTRSVKYGCFSSFNRPILRQVQELQLIEPFMQAHGSIANLKQFSSKTRLLSKTIFEISQKWLIQAAAARQPYVDQAQSHSLYLENADNSTLYSAILYAFRQGLKSIYYIRMQPANLADTGCSQLDGGVCAT